ncbi:hypothetical protein AMATHDRAFT_60672 [Amanita thiersii Skay4041]|uniref:Major facilitator superfamily (MFS) profile domain-containing protein n=1 Tax=Amanita thiersii Skay4041 TaxID=703135 RepID=A0A2A9NSK5_9AGAR|nr:hypothetical protein AMATHDRAFT_60672 [Amanita thiersii Skay4041]
MPHLNPLLKCLAIAANALSSGSIFTFPLLSPVLVSQFKLTQPQLTTVLLAGVVGQYPLASFVGKILDTYGPSFCSLAAAVAFSLSLGGFTAEFASIADSPVNPSPLTFYRLLIYSLIAGFATVFSFLSMVYAASKSFPRYIGIASGTAMSLFGLSPLFLSAIASRFFTDASGNLNAVYFMSFLAILSGSVHLFSSFPLKEAVNPSSAASNANSTDENTPLLNHASDIEAPSFDSPKSSMLMTDLSFWLLGLFCFCTLGTAEMVISNIGTIVLALPIASSFSGIHGSVTSAITMRQVQLLSFSNTVIRIVTGFIADFISPTAILSNGVITFPRKHFISRVAFLFGSSLLLAATFFCAANFIQVQASTWILSLGVGMSYGAVFTVLPSIVSAIWGIESFGRNFGLLMFAPFMGTPFFSYIYAFIAQSNKPADSNICYGRGCWQATFWIGHAVSLMAVSISITLWFRWKGRL